MREMLLAILKDIVGFFSVYAADGAKLALALVGCILVCMVLGQILYKRDEIRIPVWKMSVLFLLVLYLYIVVGITILSRGERPTREVSFELFRTFRNTFAAKKQIYENIIMFVPFSMLLYPLTTFFQKWWGALCMGACASLAIETTQWVTMTGHFEVDDILTNTIGMMIGFVVCVVGKKMMK